MPFSPNYTITITIAQDLVAIETGKKQFESIPINAMLLSSLRKSARLASTHYSTQIEGRSQYDGHSGKIEGNSFHYNN